VTELAPLQMAHHSTARELPDEFFIWQFQARVGLLVSGPVWWMPMSDAAELESR